MSRAHTEEEQRAAVQRVVDGKERPAAVARSLGIDESTLRGWRKRWAPQAPRGKPVPKGLLPERIIDVPASVTVEPPAPSEPAASNAGAPAATGGSSPRSPSAADDVAEALRAAGLGPEAPPAPGAEAAPAKDPPPSPKELVLILEVVLFVVVRSTVGVRSVRCEPQELKRMAKLAPDERDMLELLAPHAAPYVPQIMPYIRGGAALAFVGVFGLVAAARLKEIDALAKAQAPVDPRKPPRPDDQPK